MKTSSTSNSDHSSDVSHFGHAALTSGDRGCDLAVASLNYQHMASDMSTLTCGKLPVGLCNILHRKYDFLSDLHVADTMGITFIYK